MHNMKIKLSLIAIIAAALTPACQRALPPVPPSQRPAVGPEAANKSLKSWNRGSQHESDALLPFGTPRR